MLLGIPGKTHKQQTLLALHMLRHPSLQLRTRAYRRCWTNSQTCSSRQLACHLIEVMGDTKLI